MILPYNTASVLRGIYLKELKTYPHKNPHVDIYSNIIHKCPTLEATKMHFNKWMEKQNYGTFITMNDKWMITKELSNHGKIWRNLKCSLKASLKRLHIIPYDSNYTMLWKRQICGDGDSNQCLSEIRRREDGQVRAQNILRTRKSLCMNDPCHYAFVKTHRTTDITKSES